ncbi:hypothetical protein FRB95_000579 [Tulasnella sp. JGI-2019a]|nr:hypothetical protein FRB95_000579 [Tulasnella sp. JGI-2019a]
MDQLQQPLGMRPHDYHPPSNLTTNKQINKINEVEALLRMTHDDLRQIGWTESKIQIFETNRHRAVERIEQMKKNLDAPQGQQLPMPMQPQDNPQPLAQQLHAIQNQEMLAQSGWRSSTTQELDSAKSSLENIGQDEAKARVPEERRPLAFAVAPEKQKLFDSQQVSELKQEELEQPQLQGTQEQLHREVMEKMETLDITDTVHPSQAGSQATSPTPKNVLNQSGNLVLNGKPDIQEQSSILDYATVGDWIPQMMHTQFSPEQLENAKSHTTNILNSFHERGPPETLNLPLSDHAMTELQMTRMHGLVTEAAKNLPSFYLLLPQDDQELKQVAFIVSRWMQQRTILAKTIEQKRFIVGVNHLTVWKGHLTRFLEHVTAARPGSQATDRATPPLREGGMDGAHRTPTTTWGLQRLVPVGAPSGLNNLSNTQQHHLSNQHLPPGLPSQRDGALWSELQRQYAQHATRLNSANDQNLHQKPPEATQPRQPTVLSPNLNSQKHSLSQIIAAYNAQHRPQGQVAPTGSLGLNKMPGSGMPKDLHNLQPQGVPPSAQLRDYRLRYQYAAMVRAQQQRASIFKMQDAIDSGDGGDIGHECTATIQQQRMNAAAGGSPNLTEAILSHNQTNLLALANSRLGSDGTSGATVRSSSTNLPQFEAMLVRQQQQQRQLATLYQSQMPLRQHPTPSTCQHMQGMMDAEMLLKMSYEDLRKMGWEEAKIQNFEMNCSRIAEVVAMKKKGLAAQQELLQLPQHIRQQQLLEQQQQKQVEAMMKAPSITATRPPSQATDRAMPPPSTDGQMNRSQPSDVGAVSTPNLQQRAQMTGQNCPVAVAGGLPQIIRNRFTQAEVENAILHTRNITNAFSQKAPETLNVMPSHHAAIEQRMHIMHGLAMQAANNLPSFYLLLPQEEKELKQVIFILSQLMQQRTILAQNPEQKRFIFGIEHLNTWQGHLIAFLMRIKNILAAADGLGPMPPTQPQASMQQLLQQQVAAMQQLQSQSLGSQPHTTHQPGPCAHAIPIMEPTHVLANLPVPQLPYLDQLKTREDGHTPTAAAAVPPVDGASEWSEISSWDGGYDSDDVVGVETGVKLAEALVVKRGSKQEDDF